MNHVFQPIRPYPILARAALLASSLLLACGATAAAAASPASTSTVEPFTADYSASYMGLKANGKMSLAKADGDRWAYSLLISGIGAELKQSTTFDEHDGTWRPLSGSDSTRGNSGLAAMLVKKKDINANYDWATGVATWSGDIKSDRSGPVKLKKGDVDALLLNLALVRDVKAGKPLTYRMVDDGRAKTLACTAEGKESITVSGKAYPSTKAVCDNGDDKQIVVWVADDLPVPARIVQRKNGKDNIDLTLTSVQ